MTVDSRSQTIHTYAAQSRNTLSDAKTRGWQRFVEEFFPFSLKSSLLASQCILQAKMNFKMFDDMFNCWIWQCLFISKFFFKGFTKSFGRFCFKVTFNIENSHFLGRWYDNFFECEHAYHLQHVTIALDWFCGV